MDPYEQHITQLERQIAMTKKILEEMPANLKVMEALLLEFKQRQAAMGKPRAPDAELPQPVGHSPPPATGQTGKG